MKIYREQSCRRYFMMNECFITITIVWLLLLKVVSRGWQHTCPCLLAFYVTEHFSENITRYWNIYSFEIVDSRAIQESFYYANLDIMIWHSKAGPEINNFKSRTSYFEYVDPDKYSWFQPHPHGNVHLIFENSTSITFIYSFWGFLLVSTCI